LLTVNRVSRVVPVMNRVRSRSPDTAMSLWGRTMIGRTRLSLSAAVSPGVCSENFTS